MPSVTSVIEALNRADDIHLNADVDGVRLQDADGNDIDPADAETLSELLSVIQEIQPREITDSSGDVIDPATEDIVENVRDKFEAISDNDSVEGVVDQFSVEIDTDGRPFADGYYNVDEGAVIEVQIRNFGETWRTLDTIDTSEDGVSTEAIEQYPWVARDQIRFYTESEGINAEFDLSASR